MTGEAGVRQNCSYRRRMMPLAVVIAVIGITLTACGSGGTSSATSSTTAGSGPNKKAMAAVLLQVSDLPSGWAESSKAQSSSTDDAATKKAAQSIPACRDFVAQTDIEKKQTKLSSATFNDSAMPSDAANDAFNQVVGYGSEAQAKTAYAAYASSQISVCLQQVFDNLVKEQVASINAGGGPPTVTTGGQILGVPAAGDATTADEIVITVDVAGTTQKFGFVVQFVRVGQYVISYTAMMYQAAPDKFGQNLVDRSVVRFGAALAA